GSEPQVFLQLHDRGLAARPFRATLRRRLFFAAVRGARAGRRARGGAVVCVVDTRLRQRGGGRRERRGAVNSERSPRFRSDDAVDLEALARLQAAHGDLGLGAEFTIARHVQLVLKAFDRREFALGGGRFTLVFGRFTLLFGGGSGLF